MSLATLPPAASVTETRRKDFETLKGRVHQELLNRLNLERLTRVKREDAEPEIRQVIGIIIEGLTKTTPLSLLERETLVTDVLNELFGLGPLEALLKDPGISDILVNRHSQIYIEREGKLEKPTSSSVTTAISCRSSSGSSAWWDAVSTESEPDGRCTVARTVRV